MFGLGKGLGKVAGLARALKPVAPILAKGLEFAPGGPVLSAALRVVSGVVGGDPDDPASVEAALATADSEALVKLRQEEARFEASIRKAQIDLDAKRIDDVQHARDANRGSRFMPWLAGGILVAFCSAAAGVLWSVLWIHDAIDSTANSLIFAILGYLSAMAQQVSSYYFGSSQMGENAQDRVNGAGDA